MISAVTRPSGVVYELIDPRDGLCRYVGQTFDAGVEQNEMEQLTDGSLFAGIGGFCLGFQRAGMRGVWRVEIEPNCCRVLSRHFPNEHLHKDVRDFHADGVVPRPDVITFGFPCQDVSVAGRRAGLAGERSGLFHEAVRVIGEFQPKVIVCENVPGLLSSNRGRDMGTVLGALGDLGFGLAYRVFDSQWFNVAQRRKRVFIVGVSGADVRSAAQVLFEPSSMPGDSEPSREAIKNAPRAAAGCSARHGCSRSCGGVIADPLADPISTREGKTWTCEGRNNFRLRNLVGVPFCKSRRAQSTQDCETWVPGDVAPTSNQFDVGETRATTVVANGGTWWDGGDVSQTLDAVLPGDTPTAVRRLLPVEAERLQGFPDGWTASGGDGSPLSDSARYRALGNAVTVSVAEWIGRRIVAVCAAGGLVGGVEPR